MNLKKIFLILFLVTVFLTAYKRINIKVKPDLDIKNPLIGAYYYSWYPENFTHGYVRSNLIPPQAPIGGIYESKNQNVIEKHIDMCTNYGIDFLAVDYWPKKEDSINFIENYFYKAKNIDNIKFCIFFETWNLDFDPNSGTTFFNDKTIADLLIEFNKIADLCFNHKSYLKINGKPVVFLYLTRIFGGNYSKAISALKKEMAAKGYDLFLIADEVFWKVNSNSLFGNKVYSTTKPELKRIKLFDAITAYNMYETDNLNHKGYAQNSSYLNDVSRIYKQYKEIADTNGIYFVPNIIPGYNDRGTRPKEEHYVIPRKFSEQTEEGSFFEKCIEISGIPFMDEKLKMLMITSWNEWNEDTSIEPLEKTPPTNKDNSNTASFFTEGYDYEGYAFKYLEIIKEKFKSKFPSQN